jgi:hypothetical protein
MMRLRPYLFPHSPQHFWNPSSPILARNNFSSFSFSDPIASVTNRTAHIQPKDHQLQKKLSARMHDEEQECNNSTLRDLLRMCAPDSTCAFLPFIVYFPVRQLLPEIYYCRRSGEWVRVYSSLHFPRAFFRALACFPEIYHRHGSGEWVRWCLVRLRFAHFPRAFHVGELISWNLPRE